MWATMRLWSRAHNDKKKHKQNNHLWFNLMVFKATEKKNMKRRGVIIGCPWMKNGMLPVRPQPSRSHARKQSDSKHKFVVGPRDSAPIERIYPVIWSCQNAIRPSVPRLASWFILGGGGGKKSKVQEGPSSATLRVIENSLQISYPEQALCLHI